MVPSCHSGLGRNSNITIFIYTSPKCLLHKPWQLVFVGFINSKVLKLVCVDEVHLFVMFGLIFRKEFTLLKESFFKHLINPSTAAQSDTIGIFLKVLLLLMTVTFNSSLLDTLQKMAGVRISPPNYIWSSRNIMAQRNI